MSIQIPSELKPYSADDQTPILQPLFNAAIKNNDTLQLPAGRYRCNLLVENAKGLQLYGHSMETTILQSFQPDKPALQINGLWFSTIKNIGFGCSSANFSGAPIEIDRRMDPFNGTIPIQGNRFEKCCFDARGVNDGLHSAHAIRFAAKGQGYAQCDMEVFDGCYFYGGEKSCVQITGYNALNNLFNTCNFQSYLRDAIEFYHGSIMVLNCAFQANTQMCQLLNDGWDIRDIGGGVEETIMVLGCRTESLRFYIGRAGHSPEIRGTRHHPALETWFPHTQYTVAKPNSRGIYYPGGRSGVMMRDNNVCVPIVDHVSGAMPDTDKWKIVPFKVVDIMNGIEENNSWYFLNAVQQSHYSNSIQHEHLVSRDGPYYKMPYEMSTVFVNATAGPCNIYIQDARNQPTNRVIRVVKIDQTDNPVTVVTPYQQIDGDHNLETLRKTNRSLSLVSGPYGSLARSYWRV